MADADDTIRSTPAPFPVACLARRARNAKSAKDRHDNAYFAFELSVRLSVAHSPPANPANLARATVGQWVGALDLPDSTLDDPKILRLFHLLTEVGRGSASNPESITPRQLLDALPAYRNKVIGHAAVRRQEFYESSAAVLLDSIDAVWQAAVFMPGDSSLLYVQAIELGRDGRRVAGILDLSREIPTILNPVGTHVGDDQLPWRLYVRRNDEWRSLHPWILFDHEDERVYAFNGIGRHPEFMDYASGDMLAGHSLDVRFPDADAGIRALFSGSPRADLAHSRTQSREGHWLGDYRIVAPIGRGGMGVVHLAVQESLDRHVALKELPADAAGDPTAVARFRREIVALSRCDHPHVVKILGSGEDRNTRFYAMELVEGADLAKVGHALESAADFDSAVAAAVEAARRAYPEELQPTRDPAHVEVPQSVAGGRYRQVARIFRDAARGVQHIHEHRVIHRDIKPANIMLAYPDLRAVVMDFGVALMEGAPVTLTKDKNQLLGTLRYMAPEQLIRARAGIDRRTDVYGLGASMYELLTDHRFFDGETEGRLVQQILHSEPTAIEAVAPRVPRDLAIITRKATAKEPEQRYASAAELASDLDAYLDARPISARPQTIGYLLRLKIRRNKPIAIALAASFVLLVILTSMFLSIVSKERSQREAALDASVLTGLVAAAEDLWPAEPSRVAAMKAWMDQATGVVDRLPRHERVVGQLRDTGLSSATEQAKHDVIAKLVDDMKSFVDPDPAKGLMADVQARLRFAETLRHETIESYASDWAEAIRSIADLRECPKYGGLKIEAQIGLIPIGRDRDSGLWEFSHLATTAPGARRIPGRKPDGKLDVTAETGLVFVLLPGGTFAMGAERKGPTNVDPAAMPNEGPVSMVSLDPFFMSKYEMTQGQWVRARGQNRSQYRFPFEFSEPLPDFDDRHPIEQVSWEDTARVLERLGLLVPTEAQWEYACRAGTSSVFWTGNDWKTLRDKGYAANLADKTAQRFGAGFIPKNVDWPDYEDGFVVHAPVGSLLANPFGLHDVHGNVAEWCRGEYERNGYVSSPAPGDGLRTGTQVPDLRVARGGAFNDGAPYARSANRYDRYLGGRFNYIGVRPSRTLSVQTTR